ncbi:MAG: ADP-polyphosphate phosphotransferase [Planctomycetota bacterium]
MSDDALGIGVDRFRVRPEESVDLAARPTRVDPLYEDKKSYRGRLDARKERLRDLQRKFYAFDKYALLLVFQAMDAAGKDGAIRHVMSGVNPQGCQVHSFKHPSARELDHDFLWRSAQRLPERGRIGIFNRSYYEEVLVVRVHPEILGAQRIPLEHMNGHDVWSERYESIRSHEAHLHRNGTRILKFFLHMSKDEQKRRLLARIDDPRKNWKFSISDMQARERWDEYMDAYEACLSETSTEACPWYAVPADDKRNARLIISQIIVETLEALPLRFPRTDEDLRRELLTIRERLERE